MGHKKLAFLEISASTCFIIAIKSYQHYQNFTKQINTFNTAKGTIIAVMKQCNKVLESKALSSSQAANQPLDTPIEKFDLSSVVRELKANIESLAWPRDNLDSSEVSKVGQKYAVLFGITSFVVGCGIIWYMFDSRFSKEETNKTDKPSELAGKAEEVTSDLA